MDVSQSAASYTKLLTCVAYSIPCSQKRLRILAEARCATIPLNHVSWSRNVWRNSCWDE